MYLSVKAIQNIVALFKLPSICGLDLADVTNALCGKRGWLMMIETSYTNKIISVQNAIQNWKPYNDVLSAVLLNIIFNDNIQFGLDDFTAILDVTEQAACFDCNTTEIIASFNDLSGLNCDLQIAFFGLAQ